MGWIYCLLCLLTDSPGTELIAPALSVIVGDEGLSPHTRTHTNRTVASVERNRLSLCAVRRPESLGLKKEKFMKEKEGRDKGGWSSFRFLLLSKHTHQPQLMGFDGISLKL